MTSCGLELGHLPSPFLNLVEKLIRAKWGAWENYPAGCHRETCFTKENFFWKKKLTTFKKVNSKGWVFHGIFDQPFPSNGYSSPQAMNP